MVIVFKVILAAAFEVVVVVRPPSHTDIRIFWWSITFELLRNQAEMMVWSDKIMSDSFSEYTTVVTCLQNTSRLLCV